MTAALDLLAALPLDRGRWADIAAEFQRLDAEAVFDSDGPRLHFITRPRGGSKTTDAAGMVVALHLTQAPAGATSFVVAADADQAGLILDSVRSFILRAPALKARVKVEARRVVFLNGGERVSSVDVVPADEASAYGLRPWIAVADELANWPSTANARGVWAAMVSALPKVEGSRLIVASSAGSPSHWSHKVLEQARGSSHWRVSETPGPLPWISPEDLQVQRSLLTDSQYARLHENRWVAGEDRLTTPEQVRECVGHLGPIPPRRGVRYVHGLDVGLVNDRTVYTVAHAEKRDSAVIVVVDHQECWEGTKENPVDLGTVEEFCRETIKRYPGRLIFDPWQSAHLSQRLRSHGIKTEAFTFSSASVGRLAVTMFRLLRDRLIDLPDDEGLTDELAAVVLREPQPGTYRIDHAADGHDDRVISLALCAQHLMSKSVGRGKLHVAEGRAPDTALVRTVDDASPVVPMDRDGSKRSRGRPGATFRHGPFRVPRSGFTPPGDSRWR